MVLQIGNTTAVDNMRFKDTLKQKYKQEEYPQVRKTGVDGVHKKLPTEVQHIKKIVICNMSNDD